MTNKKVIIITGPTASGKTSLAIKIAKEFNGEIISADSRAIYKDIDIASAKPTIQEREGIPHWGIDIVNPDEIFTAYDFKKYAYCKINDIISRNKLPILVGGTGLYIDAVMRNYEFGNEPNYELREELNKKNIQELQEYCKKNNISEPKNKKNKRYLIRSIESNLNNVDKKTTLPVEYDFISVGVHTDRDVLRKRIKSRVATMIRDGVIKEFITNSNKYNMDSEGMKSNAYRIIEEYLKGTIKKEDLEQKISTSDWRLAKRQMTFMKRNQDIIWLDLENAEQYIREKI